jgi:hypothetical protein
MGGAVLVQNPPVVEGLVGMDEEALFWRGGFGKSIGNLGTKDEDILGCRA